MKPMHPCGNPACPTLVRGSVQIKETGKPCKYGHLGPRYVKSRGCVMCQRARYSTICEQMMLPLFRPKPANRKAYKQAYRNAHPEQKRAEDARRYARHAERLKARAAAYRKDNPEKLRAKDQAYAKSRPDVILAKSSRKYARKKFAPGRGVSAAQWKEIFSSSLGLCAYCNARAPLHLDHIDPLNRGGAHDIDNVAAVCRACNSSKNDTALLLWLATRRVRLASMAA